MAERVLGMLRAPFVDKVWRIEGLVGLREEEARARLLQDGPNELPAQQKRNLFRNLLEVAREPMFLMLMADGVFWFEVVKRIRRGRRRRADATAA